MVNSCEPRVVAIERLTKLRYAAERAVRDFPLGLGESAIQHLADTLEDIAEATPARPTRSITDRWQDD
jgi:hypothetical protein